MSGFGHLPPELVMKVASFLEKDDLCSLRLTSRYVEQHAIDHWATACFDKIFILPTKHALDKFREVSKLEKARKAIRRVYILSTVYGRNGQDNSWERYAPMILPREEEGTEHDLPFPIASEIWMDCANENVKTLRSGSFERSLRDVITALPSLVSISISTNTDIRNSHTWWGRSELIDKAGKEPCPTINSSGEFYQPCPSIQDRVCSIVMDICSLPQVNFTELRLEHFDPYRINAFKMSRSTISDCFKYLQVFTVDIELEDCRHQTNYESLFVFIGALPNLQELSVYSEHEFPYFVGFLRDSATTLKSLSIISVDEDPHSGTASTQWSKAMRCLKHEFSLEYLYIGGSRDVPPDLTETDGRGEEAVITQLNGLIEWSERGKI